MNPTKNMYAFPVAPSRVRRIHFRDSPAHVGPLQHAADFLASEGTIVRAVLDGEVMDIKDDSNLWGDDPKFTEASNFIELRHAHGEYSLYENLQYHGVKVTTGQAVKTGEVIGHVGKTGWTEGLPPHLHFMVGVYGRTVDDFQTLPIRWAPDGRIMGVDE